jgi:hypothetical protein
MAQPQFELKSALHKVVEEVDKIPDYETKKATALKMIGELGINDQDKRKMQMIINYQCPNSFKLTQYLYNSMLKFEGLGSVGRRSS